MAKLNIIFASAGVVFLSCTFYVVSELLKHFSGGFQWFSFVMNGSIATSCFSASLICFHISYLRISEKHNVVSALLTYIFMYLIEIKSLMSTQKQMEGGWKDPRRTQEDALQTLLSRNKDTEYGILYDFGAISSLKMFRLKHPLTKYDHYQDFIDRMSKGERNILLKEKPDRYCISSGTTGKSKIIPVSKQSDNMFLNCLFFALTMLRRYVFPHRSVLQSGVYFYTEPTPRQTTDGTRLGPASGMNAAQRFFSSLMYTSPLPALSIKDPYASNYIHLLFGLKDRNAGYLQAPMSCRIFTVFRQLERDWTEIVCDIERGDIYEDLNLPTDIRSSLQNIISPDKSRADELRAEFEKGFEGIIKRLWPNICYISAIDATGYGDILRSGYAKGLPIYSIFYGATEVPIIGLELNQKASNGSNDYVMIPSYAVFEFIPEHSMDEEQPNTLFIDELQIGESYELVLTGLNGMYRLRFGDVIKIKDYLKKCPIITFQYRSGLVLNVRGEKLDSATLHDVITRVMSRWTNVTVVDYAAAESNLVKEDFRYQNINPFYVIFIELDYGNEQSNSSEIHNIITDLIDVTLCEKSFTYRSYREKGEIASPRVLLVKEGSFDKLYTYIFDNTSTTPNQFKNPRKLRTAEMVELMMGQIEEISEKT